MDTPQLQPLDDSVWMGVTGSIVSQLTKTILCMQETSKGGANLDLALHNLLSKLSNDADNFIGSLNEFCQAVAKTCSCDGVNPIELKGLEPGNCSPSCSCYSSESEELECESLDCACDDLIVRPSDSTDTEKGCQVCIIEEEFTEVSTYSVDPVTNELKISKVEEYSQFSKCTAMKNQAIQCNCSGDGNQQAEDDGLTYSSGEPIEKKENFAEGSENEGNKMSRRTSSSNKSSYIVEGFNETTRKSSSQSKHSTSSNQVSKQQNNEPKKCCKCEQEFNEATGDCTPQIKRSESRSQRSSVSKSSPPSKHSLSKEQMNTRSSPSQCPCESKHSVSNELMSSNRLSTSQSLPQSMQFSSKELMNTRFSTSDSPPSSWYSASNERMSTNASSMSKPSITERAPCTSSTCSDADSSILSKRGSKEGRTSLGASTLATIQESPSFSKKRPSASIITQGEPSLQTKRSTREEQRSSSARSASVMTEPEPTVKDQRRSTDERQYVPPTCSIIEEKRCSPSICSGLSGYPGSTTGSPLRSKHSSKEAQSSSLSTQISRETQVPPLIGKQSSRETSAASLINKQSSKEAQASPVLSKHSSREASPLISRQGSKEAQVSSVMSKPSSREGQPSPLTSRRSSREASPLISKQSSKEAQVSPVISKHSSREAQHSPSLSKQSSSKEVQVSLMSRQNSKELQPSPLVSKHSIREADSVSLTHAGSATKSGSNELSKQSSKERTRLPSSTSIGDRKSPVRITQRDQNEGCSFTCCSCGATRHGSKTEQKRSEEKPICIPAPAPVPVSAPVPVRVSAPARVTESYFSGCGMCQEDGDTSACCACSSINLQRGSVKHKIKEEPPMSVIPESETESEPISSVSTVDETKRGSKDVYTSTSAVKEDAYETDEDIYALPEFESEDQSDVEPLLGPSSTSEAVSISHEIEKIGETEKERGFSITKPPSKTKRLSTETKISSPSASMTKSEHILPFESGMESEEEQSSSQIETTEKTSPVSSVEIKRKSQEARQQSLSRSLTGSTTKQGSLLPYEIKDENISPRSRTGSAIKQEHVLPSDTKMESEKERSSSQIERTLEAKRKSQESRHESLSRSLTSSTTKQESLLPYEIKDQNIAPRSVTGSATKQEHVPFDTGIESEEERFLNQNQIIKKPSLTPTAETKRRSQEDRQQSASHSTTKQESQLPPVTATPAKPEHMLPSETESEEEPSPRGETKRKSQETRQQPPSHSLTSSISKQGSPLPYEIMDIKPPTVTASPTKQEPILPSETKPKSEEKGPITRHSADAASETEPVSRVTITPRSGDERYLTKTETTEELSFKIIVETKDDESRERSASRSLSRSLTEQGSILPYEIKEKGIEEESMIGSITEEKLKSDSVLDLKQPRQPSTSLENKQLSMGERPFSPSFTGPRSASFQEKRIRQDSETVSEIGTHSVSKSREGRLSRSLTGSTTQKSKEERFISPAPGTLSPEQDFRQDSKEQRPSRMSSKLISPSTDLARGASESQPRMSIKITTDKCACGPLPPSTIDKCICTSNSQFLSIPPLENNQVNTWVNRLSDTQQTLATLRAKIEKFSAGVHSTDREIRWPKKSIPTPPPRQIHTRRECSPVPGLSLHYDMKCSCAEDYQQHHHHPRPVSPLNFATRGRTSSPSTIKQLPLMPPQAIPIQPGTIDNSHRRTCKHLNSTTNSCCCGPK